ncbi:MAG TPA: nuclear transport factor 2 family protein [Gemmatimonas sp.]|uniref:YybH family protein n=1 Tax=Gemmatimonas sp. TaxID=1962908 RepID=UPI002ED97FE3
MRTFVLLVAASLAVSPLGAQSTNDTERPLPSVTLAPALDRVLRDYEAAWARGDAKALAALFAEDGFVLQGGRPPVRGRAAIAAAYAGQGGAPLRLRALSAAVADTVGYIIGAYGYGESATDQGKFTLTLRRVKGQGPWLIFSDMDNASRPPQRPGTHFE